VHGRNLLRCVAESTARFIMEFVLVSGNHSIRTTCSLSYNTTQTYAQAINNISTRMALVICPRRTSKYGYMVLCGTILMKGYKCPLE